MIVIDTEKCIGCGLCAEDCPANKLKVVDGKAEYSSACIQCGHCVAVCPRGAVSIPDYDMDDVEEYNQEDFHIQPEHFLHAVKFRRSIRSYAERPLERKVLERILQAGRYTPTAKNTQECHFIVLEKELEEFKSVLWNKIPDLAEQFKTTMPHYSVFFKFMYRKWKSNPDHDPLFFNAPVCIIIVADHPLDGGLAAANMENMAAAQGAGVLYSGYIQRIVEAAPELKEWLGAADRTVACCMLAGYPAVTYRRTAPRRKADIEWR